MKQGDILASKYLLGELIGSGGTSKVYKATYNDKAYAVKAINKKSDKFKTTLDENGKVTEIEIARKLSHPLIPKIYEIYQDEDTIYVVMEYVDGINLKRAIDAKRKIPEETAISWAKDIIEILVYLHGREKPVVFRDLKPANLMLSRDGKIRLIDFGIAIELERDSVSHTEAVGTRGFCSPEHRKGQVDERSDIFSFGMTIYSLLIAENIKDETVIENGEKVVRPYEIVPLSNKGVTVSKEFEKIIMKCLSQDPNDRYMNASEVLSALIKLSSKTKDTKKKDKRKTIKIVLIILLIITFILAAVLTVHDVRTYKESDIKKVERLT